MRFPLIERGNGSVVAEKYSESLLELRSSSDPLSVRIESQMKFVETRFHRLLLFF